MVRKSSWSNKSFFARGWGYYSQFPNEDAYALMRRLVSNNAPILRDHVHADQLQWFVDGYVEHKNFATGKKVA